MKDTRKEYGYAQADIYATGRHIMWWNEEK